MCRNCSIFPFVISCVLWVDHIQHSRTLDNAAVTACVDVELRQFQAWDSNGNGDIVHVQWYNLQRLRLFSVHRVCVCLCSTEFRNFDCIGFLFSISLKQTKYKHPQRIDVDQLSGMVQCSRLPVNRICVILTYSSMNMNIGWNRKSIVAFTCWPNDCCRNAKKSKSSTMTSMALIAKDPMKQWTSK